MQNVLDSLILSTATERWQKVARIVALVSGHTGDDISPDAIAERIRALVDSGKLEAKGDVSRWGHSEVRHTQSSSMKHCQG
jgi:hypothetical protein